MKAGYEIKFKYDTLKQSKNPILPPFSNDYDNFAALL